MDIVNVDGAWVPEPVMRNRYGSVPDLDDEELADPAELERQVFLQEWGPVLRLPVRGRRSGYRPEIDEDGVEFGAFATVDFERTMPPRDKIACRIEGLREELRNTLVMLAMIRDRMPGRAKYLVLKYLKAGIIDLDHIVDEDMRWLARYYERVRRIRDQIGFLQDERQRKQAASFAEVFG